MTIGVLALAFSLGACTASVTTGNNSNAKPANTNSASNSASNSSSNTSSSNSSADKDKMGNKDLDFTLVNKTGYAIKGVSIGPAGDKDWAPEDEVLKGRTFGDGASLDIKFSPKATATKWDLKIDWADGDPSVEWYNVDLTTVKKLTLKYDKSSGTTSIE